MTAGFVRSNIKIAKRTEQVSVTVVTKMTSARCCRNRHCLSLESSHRSRDGKNLVVNFFDESEDLEYFDTDNLKRKNNDIDANESFTLSRYMDFSVLSMSMYHETEIQKEVRHEYSIWSPPRISLSQDDCLNSASYPNLFTSCYQQPWSIRYYKFQLGLTNTREIAQIRLINNST